MITLGVIAILVLLATGGYQAAMSQTKAMRTASNMRPVVLAFHEYAVEHNEYFPPAYFANGNQNNKMGQTVKGEGRWLASTIFAQVYPDKSSSTTGDASSDAEDVTTKDFDSPNGEFLQGTVFEVEASVKKYPKEKNFFNHSYCLNAELITDSEGYKSGNWRFTPRKRSIFPNDTNTMLIVEALEGDHNSVTAATIDQIEKAFDRYDGRFVHVGYMDGHVARIKKNDLPKDARGSDESSIFWTGVDLEMFRQKSGGAGNSVRY